MLEIGKLSLENNKSGEDEVRDYLFMNCEHNITVKRPNEVPGDRRR